MKKIIAILLCVICLFSMGGCQSFFVDETQETYSKTVNELFAALESKDANAIYNLFSVSVQNKATDLNKNIERLISLYSGPTERIGDISSLVGEASLENGKVWKSAYTTFPVYSNGEYYWFYLELIYENTYDKNQIGITQLDFCTADAYYEFWSSEDMQEASRGLNIFDKKVADYNIIAINNYPYDYRPTETLDIAEVKSFFETSSSMKEFAERFGEPAACDDFGFMYSLPEQDKEGRYLYLFCTGDKIIYSEILSNFSYIDTVLKKQGSDI